MDQNATSTIMLITDNSVDVNFPDLTNRSVASSPNFDANNSGVDAVVGDTDAVDHGRLYMIYVYCAIFAVGVVGNVWVFFLVARNRHAKAVTNIFIVNLAVADLFLMLFIPLIVVHSIVQEWVFGMFVCKLYFTCDGIYKFASITFIVLLSVDRYLAVCHPLASRSVRTVRVAFGMVGAGWTLVVLLMLPVIIHATALTNEHGNQSSIQCSIYWSQDYDEAERARRTFTFYTFSITYLIPLLLIWTFYMLILHRLRRQDLLFNAANGGGGSSGFVAGSGGGGRATSTVMSRRRRSSRRISIMVLTIVVAYTLCWMPYWFIQLAYDLYPDLMYTLNFTLISLIAYGFQMANSAINPFLYAFGTWSHRSNAGVSGRSACFCLRKYNGSANANNTLFGSINNLARGNQHLLESRSSLTSVNMLGVHKKESLKLININSNANLNTITKDRSPSVNKSTFITDPYHTTSRLLPAARNEASCDSI